MGVANPRVKALVLPDWECAPNGGAAEDVQHFQGIFYTSPLGITGFLVSDPIASPLPSPRAAEAAVSTMHRIQIYLSAAEREGLQALALRSGRSQSALIHEAIDVFLRQHQPQERLARLRQARGIWAQRTDLPDWSALRRELDRSLDGESRVSPPALSEVLVLDSDVLIDYLRDQPLAVAFLEGTEQALAASIRPQPRHRPGRCPDRRQRGGGRRHSGDPEPAPPPDAGPRAGALRQGLISAGDLSPRDDRLPVEVRPMRSGTKWPQRPAALHGPRRQGPPHVLLVRVATSFPIRSAEQRS